MSRFYAIFDKKASLYDHVQSFKSDADAVRAVRSLVNYKPEGKPPSSFAQYPSDYELFLVGEFDYQRGFFMEVEPTFIVGLGSLVDLPKESNHAEA